MKDIPSIADVKIKMMETSMLCLVFGMLGLLPVIGPTFGLAACVYSGQAREREKYHWNPARQIRITGLTCAIIGVLVWGFLDVLWGWQIFQYCAGN
jgi:hypothetical protein